MLSHEYEEFHNFIPFIYENTKDIKTFTFQVTENCNLKCTYCYQINKTKNSMTFETAKKAIDFLFDNRSNSDFYFFEDNTQGIIFEFIGGEPFLQIDLIHQIIDYCEQKILSLPVGHDWILKHIYSFSSNGTLYFEPRVQELKAKYGNLVSFAITVDGNKELHDKCRLTFDNQGSYDIAIKAALHNLKYYNGDGTKITLSPDNISYAANAVINMLSLGFKHISINPAFEEGWNDSHGAIYYEQLKILADWIVENNLQDKCYIRAFDKNSYLPSRGDDKNWCGTNSSMLALKWNGDLYTCIRFMESSLGEDKESKTIGNIENGLFYTKEQCNFKTALENLTTSSQSTEECLNCTIQSGCSWCTAYNYQKFGTINKRATFICPIHIASALGTIYFYNKINEKTEITINKNQALKIISNQEYNKLLKEG